MFKTVKSKIFAITLLMLALLMLAFVCYGFVFRMKTKQLMLKNYSASINIFVQQIIEKVLRAEDNAQDLALIGNFYYKTGRSSKLTQILMQDLFDNYEQTLGGGIWFEPYIVKKDKKRLCFYAYKNKNNQFIFDKSYESEEYDYHNQNWYKEIVSQITEKNATAWSRPYYESQGSDSMMITVGTGIYDNHKLIGISTVDLAICTIFQEVSKMKPLESGFALFEKRKEIKGSFALFANTTDDYIIVSTDPYMQNLFLVGQSLKNIPWYKKDIKNMTYMTYHNKKYVPFVKNLGNGETLIICVPKDEMFVDIDKFVLSILIFLICIGFLIPAILYISLNKNIIKPIHKLIEIAHKISNGEDVKIKIEKPQEFAQLASTYDEMTNYIKHIIKDQEKINSELSIAKSIQLSSLPNKFPPFPDRTEFDIYASMEPAKEVGGDFYDFYFIDDKNIMFLIADVSGKGVPAALFMMTVKTLIKNLTPLGYSSKELIKIINNKICENNKHEFFVTMLIGIVNTETGKLSLINCGHNQPLLKKKNGEYKYLSLNSNIVLGIFEDMEFDICEMQLEEGDILFTYTDGITEAVNEREDMYGEQRLSETLNNIKDEKNIENINKTIKQSIVDFANNTPQSDDITTLIFEYKKTSSQKEFKAPALIENYKPFYTWLHNTADEWNINEELKNKLDMCAEEIFANITFYAYPQKKGLIETFMTKTNNEIIIKFEDTGIPYNPLEKPDPDITLPAEERQLGGLGIFMVKQMAKEVVYENSEGKNRLTLIFDN